ncbi:hypothetical protein L1D59_01095 [Pseudoalteromonas piscicida]|uniref:phage exclusion protein Lit family protein n=1 Tax=Pseudoalteromonas piscicida TaxID=43662 RepID=UPI001EFD4EE0|nr:phage exclusion protein Lit family protein [Pseudoalteromonas piscicida]MCG9767195.1 hypothetical protein [Pseudoalteromonas piscicida]
MESPITVLWGNIVHAFECADESALDLHKQATKCGKLSKSIAYDNGKEKVRTPYVDLKTREINLQETYLSHLWSFIYSVFVMYEEGIQKPLINNSFDGVLRFETPLLQRAKLLFDWSISLTSEYSDWNEGLPNPRTHNNEREQFYAEKVNAIFQDAVAYFMFHEFTHLTQGHESFFPGVVFGGRSEEELAELIQMENEADQYAFSMLLKDTDDEKKRWVKGLSILFVMCSALLITPRASSIKQATHPDLDNRLLNILLKLNLETEETQFYCWYLCDFAIKFYLIKHNIEMATGKYETAQEAFFSYLDELEKVKNAKSI